MSQFIVYTSSEGNLCVCHPTGELPIEEVLIKDCPAGAIIIDESELPQGEENKYFDAWELIDGKVVVNATKKQAIIDAIEAPIAAKKSAQAKLAVLGLTEDEIKALVS
jgi:hypothetical protein